jgi:hypothetical protein
VCGREAQGDPHLVPRVIQVCDLVGHMGWVDNDVGSLCLWVGGLLTRIHPHMGSCTQVTDMCCALLLAGLLSTTA